MDKISFRLCPHQVLCLRIFQNSYVKKEKIGKLSRFEH